MTDEKRDTAGGRSQAAPTQGSAVRQAIDNVPARDIDRWQHFSKADAAGLAADPAPPEDAEKPRAGLARDGGLVEGEPEGSPSRPAAVEATERLLRARRETR